VTLSLRAIRLLRPALFSLPLLLLLAACVPQPAPAPDPGPPTTTLAPPTTTLAPPTTTTVPSNLVSVKSFGAVCDGTADDTSAVQSAANAAAGKTLYFPAGTCRVRTVAIPSGVNVSGAGAASVIKQTTLTTFNDPSPVFDAGGNNVFSDIKIDGNRVANRPDRWSDSYNDSGRGFKNSICCGRGRGYRSGIRGESISGLTVTRVEFTAIAGAAVATNMSSNITISSNNLHDSDFELAYIYGDGSPLAEVSGSNVNIIGNTITNVHAPVGAGESATGGAEPDGIVISRANGGSVSGNTLNGIDRDFLKLESDQNFTIANNTASNGTGIGYPAMQISPWYTRHDLHSINIRVTGNHFSGPGFFNAVQVNSDDTQANVAQNIEVDHNTITANGMTFGVQADGNAGLNNISIHDNAIAGTSSFALYVWGGGTTLSMQANTHAGIAMSNVSVPGAFASATYLQN
jgi:hypothetical protein